MSDPETEIEPPTLSDWLIGWVPCGGYNDPYLRSEDSITRLGLSGRTESALLRNCVCSIALLIEIVDHGPFALRGIGDKGWHEIEAALERPLPPMEAREDTERR